MITQTSRAMTSSLLRLGVRLATGRATDESFRPVAMACVGALSALVLLHTFATSNASAALNLSPTIGSEELNSIRWVVQLGVSLPFLGLVATAARLSAASRDRRIARLRVLGLTQSQTGFVAIIETVVLLVVGIGIGALLYLATRPLLAGLWFDAAEFPREGYHAGLTGWFACLVGLPVLAIGIAWAMVPRDGWAAMRADRSGTRPSAVWRVAILLAGVAAVLSVTYRAHHDSLSKVDSWLFPLGAGMLVAGIFVTVPLATRLTAAGLLRGVPVASVRIAGRRLQHLPPGAGRVVTATVAAVFVLALLQPLAQLGERDPSVQGDRAAATTGPQLLRVYLDRGTDLPMATSRLRELGITRVDVATELESPTCSTGADGCLRAHVGTCWSLSVDRTVPQCRDDQAAWLNRRPESPSVIELINPQRRRGIWRAGAPESVMITTARPTSLNVQELDLFIPAASPGLADWLEQQPIQLIVEGPGGIGVEQVLQAGLSMVLPGAHVISTRAFANYTQTRNTAMVLDAVTITVLLIGLLAFLLASIDQVLGRRSSISSLLVIGVPASTLRLAQLWESLTPFLIGLPFAAGLGFLTGSTYVQLSTTASTTQWNQLGVVLLITVIGAVASAVALLVLAVPMIKPSLIRRP